MKKIIAPLFLTAALTCMLLAGCSKSDQGPAPAKETGNGPQGPVELKVKWQAGKLYREQMTMHQDMELAVPGSTQTMHQQMVMEQEYSLAAIKDRPDGGQELELKFISQKVSSRMGGKEIMSFDSTADPASDGANPAAAILRKVIGAHVRFLVDAKGKVEKIEDYDQFIQLLGGDGSPQSQMVAKGMFNEENLKQFGDHGQGLPDKPVKVGDSWPFNIEMQTGPLGALKIATKCKFAGWEQHDGHNCAVLAYSGDISSKASDDSGVKGIKMNIEKGTITGKHWFDPALGTTIGGDSGEDMTLNMEMGGKETKSKMTQKITLKLLEVADIPK